MVTQTHSPFETLARVIEHLDGDGRSVRRTEASGSGEDGSLRATVVISVGTASEAEPDLEPVDAAVDGGLAVTFRAPAFPDLAEALAPEYPRVSATPAAVHLDGDSVVVTLEVTIGADRSGDEAAVAECDEAAVAATTAFGAQSAGADVGGGDVDTETDHDVSEPSDRHNDADAGADSVGADMDDADTGATSPLSAVRDESVPAYDDTPYLRRLYDVCETFAEMSERIEMDVSAETVRRYMTDAGVHSPISYETTDRASGSSNGTASDTVSTSEAAPSASANAESATDTGPAVESADPASRGLITDGDSGTSAPLPDEQLVADGIGLPESLTLYDVVDAVVDARTVHEVQRGVGLGYDRTRQLLCQLNLLDLVVGRVSGNSDRTVTVDVVADRIRESAPDAV